MFCSPYQNPINKNFRADINKKGEMSSPEYVAYRFWLYQYSYRNIQCANDARRIADLGVLATGKGIDPRTIMFAKFDSIIGPYRGDKEVSEITFQLRHHTLLFMRKYNICPCATMDGFYGFDSGNILRTLIKKKKLKMEFYDKVYHQSLKGFEYDPETSNLKIEVNLNHDYTTVLLDVAKIIDNITGEVDNDFLFYIHERKFRKKLSKLSPTSNASRAIGLWIWDNINIEFGMDKPPHGTISKTIHRLKDKFDLSSLGYSASANRTFSNMYYKTCKCIEDREVYSI
ncbi:hypothetical protein [Desulfolutivibrio sulfoxidireducens]|uniref:hypothetical protein n=1 Tax=Desulfolutivibrio sulfoxidireducens TaxID=2773299 RepID=UPI00159E088C|nr:hypothetical protein [Desulfolutivibrio sulfoxidireducens]QLA15720.1 hypothetical protein GD605_05930 [Desulfolutivibrio sulfoxidireducens]